MNIVLIAVYLAVTIVGIPIVLFQKKGFTKRNVKVFITGIMLYWIGERLIGYWFGWYVYQVTARTSLYQNPYVYGLSMSVIPVLAVDLPCFFYMKWKRKNGQMKHGRSFSTIFATGAFWMSLTVSLGTSFGGYLKKYVDNNPMIVLDMGVLEITEYVILNVLQALAIYAVVYWLQVGFVKRQGAKYVGMVVVCHLLVKFGVYWLEYVQNLSNVAVESGYGLLVVALIYAGYQKLSKMRKRKRENISNF